MGALKLITLEEKLQKDYCVRSIEMPYTIKDIDMKKRTVTGVLNTYLYYDSFGDVLVPGVSKQSITERGPESDAIAKIKFAKNHDLTVRPGRFTVLDERKIEGNNVLYFEAELFDTTDGNNTLIEYQQGGIDNHSIGFNYVQLELVKEDAEDWDFWLAQLINPEKADDNGWMWIVKQIKLWEGSALGGFGANDLTPFLGVKGKMPSEVMILKIFSRIDKLSGWLKSGTQTDDRMKIYEIQLKQLKQTIREIFEKATEPDFKDTLIEKPSVKNILLANDLNINIKNLTNG